MKSATLAGSKDISLTARFEAAQDFSRSCHYSCSRALELISLLASRPCCHPSSLAEVTAVIQCFDFVLQNLDF